MRCPIPLEDVLLPAGNYVVNISSADVSIDSLVIEAGVALNISNGHTLSLITENLKPLTNAGTVTIDGAGTELVIVGPINETPTGNVTNTGTLHVINGGKLELNDVTVANSNGTFQVEVNSTLNLQTVLISNGTIINFGLIEATDGNNAIHNASITNNAGGTFEATGAQTTLTIDAGSTVTNSGLLEAIDGALFTLTTGNDVANETGGVLAALSGATLDIKDTVTNLGTIEAGDGATTGTVVLENDIANHLGQLKTNGGVFDFKGSSSTTIVVDNTTTVDGILVDAAGKLIVDVGTLELTGSGQLDIQGGLITGQVSGNVLDNDGNQITGFGQITNLTLQNENGGLVEALGGTLVLNTTNTILNDSGGTLEASSTGTLEIHDSVTNTGTGQLKTNAGTIDFHGAGSTTIVLNNTNASDGVLIDALWHGPGRCRHS